MKHTYKLLILLLFISASSCTPMFRMYERDGKLLGILPLKNGKVVYRETVRLENLSKEEIFRRARRWWVNNYRSAQDVFQLVDKETGEIVGKGYGRVYAGKGLTQATHNIYHVISFDVTPGEYTVTVYGMSIENNITRNLFKQSVYADISVEHFNVGSVKYVKAIFVEIDKHTLLTMKSLRDYITNPSI